jgi:hypothetical protein
MFTDRHEHQISPKNLKGTHLNDALRYQAMLQSIIMNFDDETFSPDIFYQQAQYASRIADV